MNLTRITCFTKLVMPFFIAILWLVCACHHQKETKYVGNSSNTPTEYADNDLIFSRNIPLLSSDDSSQQELAMKEIINLANQSEDSRKNVINKLMEVIQARIAPERDYLEPPLYRLFDKVMTLFVSLQATEAIELMISHAGCHGGKIGMSMRGLPAQIALSSMGESAVPKLAYALRHDKDPEIRGAVALCLCVIASNTARKALVTASATEKDSGVREVINGSIIAIDRGKN